MGIKYPTFQNWNHLKAINFEGQILNDTAFKGWGYILVWIKLSQLFYIVLYTSLWDTVKGPPPDLKGKKTFTPHSGFTLGTPVFTHLYPCQAAVLPRRKVITEARQYHKK